MSSADLEGVPGRELGRPTREQLWGNDSLRAKRELGRASILQEREYKQAAKMMAGRFSTAAATGQRPNSLIARARKLLS